MFEIILEKILGEKFFENEDCDFQNNLCGWKDDVTKWKFQR